MKKITRHLLGTISLLAVIAAAQSSQASQSSGEFRLGGIIRDDYGSASAYMPGQQYHEGFSVSLDKLRYSNDRGWRLMARARDLTLNSRDLAVTLGHRSEFSLSARNDQMTRVYSPDGNQYGRRHLTQFDTWVEPISSLRFFGSFSDQKRTGVILSTLFPIDSIALNSSDFHQQIFRGGARYDKDGYVLEADARVRDFDDRGVLDRDREGQRYRLSGRAPLPGIQNVFVNGGFMTYTEAYKNSPDSFLTNTGWGGARCIEPQGASLKYSFVYDRSRRTGDLLATDNIIQSLSFAKNWTRKGGIQVGGQYRYRDNLTTVLESFGFNGSIWIALTDAFTVRGAAGTESRELEEGSLINGVRGLNRGHAQLEYRKSPLQLRVRYSRETRSYDDLGTTNDFDQISADGSYTLAKVGDFSASYAYRKAQQETDDGRYDFDEHVVGGDFSSVKQGPWSATLSGLYQRATGDIDVETANGAVGLRYDFTNRIALGGKYSAYNFDNFKQRDIPTAKYSDYATINIVELSLIVSW